MVNFQLVTYSLYHSSRDIDTSTESTNNSTNNSTVHDYEIKKLRDNINTRSSPSHNTIDEIYKCLGVDKNELKNINLKNDIREGTRRHSLLSDKSTCDIYEYNFFEKKGDWNPLASSTRDYNSFVGNTDTYPDFKPHHNSTGCDGNIGNINLRGGEGTFVSEERVDLVLHSTPKKDSNFSSDSPMSSLDCGNNKFTGEVNKSFSDLANSSLYEGCDSNNFTNYIKASPISESQFNPPHNLTILGDKDPINLYNLSGDSMDNNILEQYYNIFDSEIVAILYDIIASVFGGFFNYFITLNIMYTYKYIIWK